MEEQPEDGPAATSPSSRERLIEWLCIALVITAAFLGVPTAVQGVTWRLFPARWQTPDWWHWYFELMSLAVGVLLVIGAPRRNGLCLGRIREHWKGVLIVCGLPVLLTALVYPRLPERPYAGAHITLWLTSPWAQDFVFVGFLYARLALVAPSYVHRRVRIRWALVITAAFFALYHVPNLLAFPGWFVAMQVGYTFLGMVLVGLARQWTGSLLYGALSHAGLNLIAWMVN